jgi:hypothetical protein
MLYKSGYNLKDSVIEFIKNNESITLFSAYIKLSELKEINFDHKIKQIIVRWEIEDLCKSVSDIEVYNYCLENNITMYRNTRLHMKVLWNNNSKVVHGSANITGKGVGEKGNFNYEINGAAEIDYTDIQYFYNIINKSQFVDDNLYGKIKKVLNEIELQQIDFPEILVEDNKKFNFLLSQLPMTLTPKLVIDNSLSIKTENLSNDDIKYIMHDLVLYNINNFSQISEIQDKLKNNFNSHPFILEFKKFVINQEKKSIHYGGCVKWIQENTTSVPIPRSWDLKKDQIVNILYNWVCFFDSNFVNDVPFGGHSQILYYRPI